MSRFSVLESYHIHYGTANTMLYWQCKISMFQICWNIEG